jgi:acetyl esterase/lipase
MKAITWVTPVLLLLIACLNFNTTQNLTLWMASIVVTEYGQWFVVACVVLAIVFYPNRFALVVLLIAGSIFALPSFQLATHASEWKRELAETFPSAQSARLNEDSLSKVALPRLGRLFSLSPLKPHPETLVYENVSGQNLSLDFFKSSRANSPFLLVIHGGGWDGGDRSQFADMSQFLANAGYAVASIDYRLAPKNSWPAPKEDSMAAIRYLREHAHALQIDPEQFVIFGRSAGGQIAERVAYATPKLPGLKGCIAFYSPADLNFAYQFGEENDILKSPTLLRNYMGGAPAVAQSNFDDASAIRFVNRDTVPTLLMHGPRDPLVWVRQSERLIAKLKSENVKSVFIRVPWATHGFDYNLNGPGGQLATFSIIQFLEGVFHS